MPQSIPDLSKLSPEQKRKLLQDLLARKSDTADAPSAWSRGFTVPEEFRQLKARMDRLAEQGVGEIYFQCSEGINTNLTSIAAKTFVNYCGYNYLGLSGHPEVAQAAKDAIERYGTSGSASRLASGERPIHRQLEQAIADFLGTEAAIVFVGGFSTNVSVVGHLCGQGDLILYDSLIHASIQAGARLSGAQVRVFPHNNAEALGHILAQERSRYNRVLIVIEGAYSMDGDIPDLRMFVGLRNQYGCLLMVDEAHSLGVLGARGAGIGEYHKVAREDLDIWMGTLSKSLASCGGYIAGSSELVEYLRYSVPGFVYSCAITPANAAAALAALQLMRREPSRVAQLQDRVRLFLDAAKARGLNTGSSRDTAVIPIVTGRSEAAVGLYKALYDGGIYALPIMYPVVPEGAARLRFFVTCLHTEDQIRDTVDAIDRHLGRGGRP